VTANGKPDRPRVVHTRCDVFPLGEAALDAITVAGHRYQGICVRDEDLVGVVAALHAHGLTASRLAKEAA
jgi:hypothetical protein